jgi:hypothetical protein
MMVEVMGIQAIAQDGRGTPSTNIYLNVCVIFFFLFLPSYLIKFTFSRFKILDFL